MITSLTATPLDPYTYRLDFTSDHPSPTFYVYASGSLIATTTDMSLIVPLSLDSSVVYDVLDDPLAVPTTDFPGAVTLAWYANPATASYRIEQYDGAAWNEVATIQNDGRVYYRWESTTQPDGVVAQFRIIPTGTNGNDGSPSPFTVLVVRYPDPPAVSYSYSATDAKITIAAA